MGAAGTVGAAAGGPVAAVATGAGGVVEGDGGGGSGAGCEEEEEVVVADLRDEVTESAAEAAGSVGDLGVRRWLGWSCDCCW